MKKLIILGLILIGIIVIPPILGSKKNYLLRPYMRGITEKDTSFIEESEKWEYVKTRLFPIGGEITPKFKGPILVSLENASEVQRNMTRKILYEIDSLLPNETIRLFKDHTGFTSQEVIDSVSNSSVLNNLFDLYINSISITFGEKPNPNTDYLEPSFGAFPKLKTSVLSDSTVIKRNRYRFHPQEEIKGAIISFQFSEASTEEQKRKYIKYEILRSLCRSAPQGIEQFIDKNPIQRFHHLDYILNLGNGVFSSKEYDPENYELNQYDKFLLQKLYSKELQSELKSYLTSNYETLYTYNFYHSRRMKIGSQILTVILGALIFLLSLSYFHKRRFKFGIVKYLTPILVINLTILGLFNLGNYLQLKSIFVFYFSNIAWIFILRMILLSVAQSIFIWALEYFFTRRLQNFTLNVILKVTITFVSFTIPYYSMSFYPHQYGESILLISLIIALSRGLYLYLNHFSESIIRKKDLELSQLKELQLATELNSLHAQINPHFLYNALNSIASLSKTDGDKTEKMALTLSDLFRYSVNRKGEKMSTIKGEVEMVQNYLQIEKIRFEDRLEYTIDVDSAIEDTQIPRFILQPLIENAIKHGVSKIEGKGLITLKILKENDNLSITVSDNGPHFPDGLLSGHGLQSVFDLLRLSYGEQASMNWENLPKKKITIIINSH